MVVEVVGTVSGAQRCSQVQRRLVVLTVGMLIRWTYQAAPGSVASLVGTLLWTLVAIAVSSMTIAASDEEPPDEDACESAL